MIVDFAIPELLLRAAGLRLSAGRLLHVEEEVPDAEPQCDGEEHLRAVGHGREHDEVPERGLGHVEEREHELVVLPLARDEVVVLELLAPERGQVPKREWFVARMC